MFFKKPKMTDTIRIRLLCSLAGHTPNRMGDPVVYDYPNGAILDWDAREARRMIERGTAVLFDEAAQAAAQAKAVAVSN